MTSFFHPPRIRVIVRAAVLVLALVLAGQLAWKYWSAYRLEIRHILLDSDLGLSDGQLLEMLDIAGETWGSVDVNELEAKLEAYPVIRKARVLKAFPDALKVYLYRRKPLAITLTDGPQGGSLPAVFDEEGYTVKVGELSTADDLPIISGPRFGQPVLGARFPEAAQGILFDLTELRESNPKLFAMLSEIEILSQGGDRYHLRLYMNHIGIPVLVGRNLTVENLQRAALVLDVLSSGAAGQVEEADIRGENVVYRRVEESGNG